MIQAIFFEGGTLALNSPVLAFSSAGLRFQLHQFLVIAFLLHLCHNTGHRIRRQIYEGGSIYNATQKCARTLFLIRKEKARIHILNGA